MTTRSRLLLVLGGLFFAVAMTSAADDPIPDAPGARPGGDESLKKWKYFLNVNLPDKGNAALYDFVVPAVVLDRVSAEKTRQRNERYPGGVIPPREEKEMPVPDRPELSRDGLNDLRLFDARGREVPHVLRVRRGGQDQKQVSVLGQFNPSTNDQHQAQVTLDLGADARHNSIVIRTPGSEFRRKALIEGSDDNATWSKLLEPVELLSFHSGNQSIEVNRFEYQPSRRRYVRVTVSPDPAVSRDEPRLEQVTFFQVVQLPPEDKETRADVSERQEILTDQGMDSAWDISFGGLKVPCKRLRIDASDKVFARRYQLRQAVEGGTFLVLAQGVWRREAGSSTPLEVQIGDVEAKQLRFVVTDSRNLPLTLTKVLAYAPVRQVIFPALDPDTSKPWEGPLKLYFGNPNAAEPHYDFAAHLPARIEPPPTRIDLGEATLEKNPDYRPTLTERYPWLVYVVLGAASLFLLVIIGLLAGQALSRTPPTPVATV